MIDSARHKLLRENYNLRLQLKAANTEIVTVRGSKAYRIARLAGHAQKQLRQSPLKFTKKVIRKLSTSGTSRNISGVGDNLIGLDDLQSQYQQWIVFNEPDATELERQRIIETTFKKRPLISIVTPVFNPPTEVFRALIESVTAQTYTNFELCLGNFGDDPVIAKIIHEYASSDDRIKSYPFTENKGIAENSNQILEKVQGEFIALLDHDDTLSPDALFENIVLLNQADYDFIYSDKDKINEVGDRFDPFFKPDWSPEIMLNANYLTHLNVFKTSLTKRVGGWDSKTDGAQDWDLFFKIIQVSKKIGHIPKVLYHWRVIATSTAHSIETKPYALQGQRTAVDAYLRKLKVHAKTYHSGAELLLEWPLENSKVEVVVKATNDFRLRQFIHELKNSPPAKNVNITVFHDFTIASSLSNHATGSIRLQAYAKGNFQQAIKEYLAHTNAESILIINDGLSFKFTRQNLNNLFGWLTIPGVVAVSPRVSDVHGRALDCGALLTSSGLMPIFQNSVSYHQAAIGNIEWIRNLKVPSALVLASSKENLQAAMSELSKHQAVVSDEAFIPAIGLALSMQGRLVLNTKVMAVSLPKVHIGVNDMYESATPVAALLGIKDDPYMNLNLSPHDPMRLILMEQEPVERTNNSQTGQLPSDYTIEATEHALSRSLSLHEVEENLTLIHKLHAQPLPKIESAVFILPGFNAIYAGLNNILSYADFLQNNSIKICFAILAPKESIPGIQQLIMDKFPNLGGKARVMALDAAHIEELPPSDIAICTQWATAYCLAQYHSTKRKCYFIQDKEASFYAKGTISALAENTYNFGFYALAGTPGLLDWYEQVYDGKGTVIKSTVDLSACTPAATRPLPKPPYKIFFYGRPNEPRNAFELGVAALIKLKQKHGSQVEIYTAGSEWDPADFGLENILVNMGKIAYDKLPAFYRSMDVGLMFMFSGHPGVVASELMASGCAVIVNQYDDKTWNELYEHETDCLVSYPTATAIVENIERLLDDNVLRLHITDNALVKVKGFYKDYEVSCEKSLALLKKPLPD